MRIHSLNEATLNDVEQAMEKKQKVKKQKAPAPSTTKPQTPQNSKGGKKQQPVANGETILEIYALRLTV